MMVMMDGMGLNPVRRLTEETWWGKSGGQNETIPADIDDLSGAPAVVRGWCFAFSVLYGNFWVAGSCIITLIRHP